MAPNLKRTQLLLQTVDLDLIQPVKAAFPPLTSEDAQQSQQVTTQTPQQDSSSYWEWSAENDAEINKIVDEERLSADHIVANVLRQPAAPASSTLAANDQYWDCSYARTESTDYWNWQSTNDEQTEKSIESDSYWAW
eukprot:CAMPEP_0113614288 /NCGR_PEP_ID=MMETSP0017_2-20120614/7086_1 /TAXON_ID=2856 /ORGANISM="Cylindrotheca closterium" /LENGTH=136 /DNA_ID=CAMNT_0000523445 /DNA_START=40 /DNA_END=450 /DNA_ORIENTATION=+ /assembly_acc=CAM_ASM_000147